MRVVIYTVDKNGYVQRGQTLNSVNAVDALISFTSFFEEYKGPDFIHMAECLDETDNSQWRFCSGECNRAD